MNAVIKQIEYYLPEKIVSNDDLRNEFPAWDVDKIQTKSGVASRHIAAADETALDLSIKACEKLFSTYDKNQIDGIIYCTQSPDYIMPSNSFLLQKHFSLNENLFCYDFNHACTGYIYGLMMANSYIKSGLAKKILLVTADTYSKYINPADRSTRVLFGDAAAVSVIEATDKTEGIIDLQVATFGNGFDKFIIPAGGARLPQSPETAITLTDFLGNVRTKNNIKMDGMAVWSFINSKVPDQINNLLERNHLTVSDIDLIVFHQASLMTLDSLIKILNLDQDKVFINIRELGNTVSASIPIALKDAIDTERIKKNQRLLLSGFGVGLAYGTILINT
ncbi:ketoacyl-ACP synthase III [Sediminibacterium sp.]|uniref:ketoacyl-ACP synthase III n=1 Tax=Sediminibacterium sp. TaxID=1917865 RepID=UPI0025D27BFC|nr:ketoacyl-ACP synthase III [Sediminibacterium sp.]MBW0177660.1 ketoacyl-ACP synthase III [Sediminibacterium sp.]